MTGRLAGVAILLLAAALIWLSTLHSGQAQTEDCALEPYAAFQAEQLPRLRLEVARTPTEQSVGLMYRSELAADAGMLFVYEVLTSGGFWMHNTYIPLSIAFVEPDGTINTILDMQPQTDDIHLPARPYLYAIETNQGWYAQNGVRMGDTVRLCYE